MRFHHQALALTSALFLVACGGGGGGDEGGAGGGGNSAPIAAEVTITEAAALAITAEAVGSVANTDSALAGAGLATGVQVDTGSGASASNAAALKLAQSVRTIALFAKPTASAATGVAFDETQACDAGGTLRVSGSVADDTGGQLAAGDSISTTADNCRIGDGAGGVAFTINGSFSLTINSGSFGATGFPPFNVAFTISMTNYSISDGTENIVFNGDSRFDWMANSDTDQTLTVSGGTFATFAGSQPVVWRNYRQAVTVNGFTTSSDLDAIVESTNTRVGTSPFSYAINTTTPFAIDSAGNITAGSMTLTGKGSSGIVTVTATNTFTVQLDANGDGTYEKTLTATLTELQALL